MRDWLDYAVREVPQLQEKWVADDLKLANLKSPWLKDIPKRGFNNAGGGVLHHIDPSQVGLQTPRAFYRRESEREPFVIAHKVKSGS